ncbi:MAG: 16S rRNA (adenine(1518)-N(6)/adenine(1519)-N(6))-dimethyltransferase, partial [Clostridia bacterium]|nr:16S rRNA (adenine(1518)-N(6)/adenine(1519)-N(6))-dimethyltransferase [Clostridia bacterium]
MVDLTSPTEIKRIMDGLGRGFNKSLGQNFLIDRNVLDEIVSASGIDKSFGVIEIGPGIGTLTQELLKSAGKVVSIELDRQIAGYLEKAFAFYENFKIINADALKIDLKAIIKSEFGDMPCAVVANLPYYITTPLIMKFLEDGARFESITVMIQKEVAKRLDAKCGTK